MLDIVVDASLNKMRQLGFYTKTKQSSLPNSLAYLVKAVHDLVECSQAVVVTFHDISFPEF